MEFLHSSVCGLLTAIIYSNGWYLKAATVYSDRGFGRPIFLLFYFFISSPLQEVLFRGVLFEVLGNSTLKTLTIILFSSLIYTNSHFFYIQLQLILFLTFLLGLFWALDYSKNKSLLIITLSHGILGKMAFLLNLA